MDMLETHLVDRMGLEFEVEGYYYPPEYGYGGFFELTNLYHNSKKLDTDWFTNEQLLDIEREIEGRLQNEKYYNC